MNCLGAVLHFDGPSRDKGKRASYSNFGSAINVAAPGGERKDGLFIKKGILSTLPNYPIGGKAEPYGYQWGTSQAAPHVSGLAALILSVRPNTPPVGIRSLIELTADDLGDTGWDPKTGFGRINAHRALLGLIDTLFVADTDQAPPSVTPGQQNVIMEKLDLTVQPASTITISDGAVILDTLQVNQTGSAIDSDFTAVKLLESDQTTVIASSTFTNGTVTFSNLNRQITTAATDTIYIALDIAATATVDNTITLNLQDNTYVTVQSPDTVDSTGFPITSGQSTITSAADTLTITGTDQAPSAVTPGQTDVIMEQLDMSVTQQGDGIITLDSLQIDQTGTAIDTDFNAVKLLESDQTTVIANSTFTNGSVTFSNLNRQITTAATDTVYIALDISASATTGNTITLNIQDNTYLTVQPPDTVNATGFPIASGTAIIADGGSWQTVASMSTKRFALAGDVVNGRFYAVGGWNSISLSTVEEYDPATNSWRTVAPMPTPRHYLAVVALNGKLYAIGGIDTQNNIFSTVEEYDPVTNSWQTVAPMPTPRYVLATTVVNGKIYAIGGIDNNNSSLSTVEVYDSTANSWQTVASMPTARDTAATVVSGKIYAIGGWPSGSITPISTVEEYDPLTDSWQTVTPLPAARYSHSVATVNGKIYVIGGADSSTPFSTVEEYDPLTDSWRPVAPLPTTRYRLAVGVVNGEIYAVAGANSNNNLLSINEKFTPPSLSASAPARTVLQITPPQLKIEPQLIPRTTKVFQNYPNPFNPETWIPYQLAQTAQVTIRIYDAKGQLIRTLDIGEQSPGVYTAKSRAAYWDGRNQHGEPVSGGLYFYHLTAGEFQATRKFAILK